jgi:branched-chain amino acid transport system substrate-binding protein
MKELRFRLLTMATVILLALSGLAACGGDSDGGGAGGGGGTDAGEPLKIGAALALTGDLAFSDVPNRQGIEYAVDQLNAKGGIDGHKIELMVKDMKSDAKLSGVVAQELLDDGAAVLIAPSFPEVNIGVIEAGAAQDVASLIPLLTTPVNVDIAKGTVVLPAFSDPQQVAAVAEFAAGQGAKTAVTVSSPDHPYTQNNPKYFVEAFEGQGGEVIGDVQFTIGQTEFDSVARKVADRNPDIVFTSMFLPDTPVFLKALRAAGFDGAVYGSDGFDSPALIEVAGKAAENVFFTVAGFPEPGSELAKVIDGITQETGKEPESAAFAGLGYDSIQVIKAAVVKAGSVDSSDLTPAFDDLGTVPGTVTGEITLEGHNQFPTKPVTVVAVENGKLKLADEITPTDVPAP